jgi:hypothetical protein
MTGYSRLRIGWLATGAVACGLALTVASASGGRAAASTCKTSWLVVWMDTRVGAAAGTAYYTLELTNQSGHSCTMFGYPGSPPSIFAAVSLGTQHHGVRPHATS